MVISAPCLTAQSAAAFTERPIGASVLLVSDWKAEVSVASSGTYHIGVGHRPGYDSSASCGQCLRRTVLSTIPLLP